MTRFLILLALLLGAPLARAQETATAPAESDAAAPAQADRAAQADEAEAAPEKPIARIATIKLKIDGTEDPHPPMPFGITPRNFHGVLQLLRKAAADDDLHAVILEPKGFGVGLARLLEVRDAIRDLQHAGKKVYYFQEQFGTYDLVLASAADHVAMPESGWIVAPGVASEMLYMKGMLDKLHLSFDVVHIGEYKTAGESFVRDRMSEAMKEELDPILDEVYRSVVRVVAEGRGLTEAAVRGAVDKGILTAREAKEIGLIDAVQYEDGFRDAIKEHFADRRLKVATDYERDRPQIDPNNPMAAFQMVFSALMGGPKESRKPGPRVAVIYCTGPITTGKSQYDWGGGVSSMGSDTIVEAIEKAHGDDDVKAIVLRINSPGGSGLASDLIWHAIENARADKPVIASMGDVAASGGYYIAMNSHVILADPQTVTGSIGVVGMMPNMDEFWPWIGIRPERLSRGRRAEMLMTSKGLDEDGKLFLRDLMKEFYGDFVAKVAKGRGRTPAEIEPIARGRVWTGRDALRLGLIDRLGGLEDAIALARKKGGIGEGETWHLTELPRRAGPFQMFEDMFGVRAPALGIDAAMLEEFPALRRALAQIAAVKLIARDKVACMAPELAAFARPVADVGE